MITNESLNLMINNSGNLDAERLRLFNKGILFIRRMEQHITNQTFGKFALNNSLIPLFGKVVNIDFEDGSGWNFCVDVVDPSGDKWNLFYTTRTEVFVVCRKVPTGQ